LGGKRKGKDNWDQATEEATNLVAPLIFLGAHGRIEAANKV